MFFSYFIRTFAILLAFFIFLFSLIAILSILNKLNSNNFVLINEENNSQNSIFVIKLNGPIIDDSLNFISFQHSNTINPKMISDYLNEISLKKPKVIIFRINSPGGTVSATNKIYNIIDDFKNKNDVEIIFYTDNLLTSGGYWIALSGDSIIANYGSIIGSIGVSSPQWIFFNEPISISTGYFGEKIDTNKGIEIFSQNAGKSKDLFNPFRRPSKEELNHLSKLTNNIYNDFITTVSKIRKIEKSYLENEIGALIFDTKIAKENYLIDDILDFEKLIKKVEIKYNFDNYNLYINKDRPNLLRNYFRNNFTDQKKLDLCNILESNFVVVSPKFLSSC